MFMIFYFLCKIGTTKNIDISDNENIGLRIFVAYLPRIKLSNLITEYLVLDKFKR